MGDMLGPYEIRGELGRGAMAVVWRAFDPRLEREVAIKEPVIPHGMDPALAAEMGERFVREGRAAARLNHHGIVTIHAADTFDGRPAIVMEMIDGDVFSRLLEHGPMSPVAVAGVLDQLLDAVGFAHSRGVVHRDIKPDNVFITSDGRVKLADFGIAHVGSGAGLTVAGSLMGTPGYMAPEQVTGSRVDERTDLFAIGAMAYEMLTGRNPFGLSEGEAGTTVMYRIVHEDPLALPPGTDVAGPVALGPVLATALAKDPAQRFASAAAFRQALGGGPLLTAAMTGAGATVVAHGPRATLTASAVQTRRSQNPGLWIGVAGGAVALLLLLWLAMPGSGGGGGASVGVSGTATSIDRDAEPGIEPSRPAAHDLTPFASASASSEKPPESGYTYYASQMLDGDPTTCWQENVGGYGIGETVTFSFDQPVVISGIDLVPGYLKHPSGSHNRWWTNGRLESVELVFDDGTRAYASFDETIQGAQAVGIDAPVQTSQLTLRVTGVYPARTDGKFDPADTQDLSMSEITFAGWLASEYQ